MGIMVCMACRCFDIFTPPEQKVLKKYREENFKEKRLIYKERRAIGKCPLTPEEVIHLLIVVPYLLLTAVTCFY